MNIEQLKDIINNGSLYYPAWKHYGGQTNVKCNRCKKPDLAASIGYRDNDLCLICVEKITQYLKQREPQQQIPESFRPPISLINSNSSNMSFMESNYENNSNPTNIGNLLRQQNYTPQYLNKNSDLDSFFPNVQTDKSFQDAIETNVKPPSNTYERFW